jgi:hypothetical protein
MRPSGLRRAVDADTRTVTLRAGEAGEVGRLAGTLKGASAAVGAPAFAAVARAPERDSRVGDLAAAAGRFRNSARSSAASTLPSGERWNADPDRRR